MTMLRNFAGLDKETARQQWEAKFKNRSPIPRAAHAINIKAASPGETEIMLYDEIGFFGVSAKEFNTALAAVTTPSICVRINSPGGDVFDGLAIYNALKQHPSSIVAQVDGIAASAASFIALAADKVVMSEHALMMVHPAWGLSIGNKSDMLETATILEKIDAQLAGIYAAKTGKDMPDIVAMMEGDGKNDGTWFTAQEAFDYGLVDEIRAGAEPEEEDRPNAEITGRYRAMLRRLALAERD